MNYSEAAVYVLLVVIGVLMAYFLLQDKKKKEKEIFSASVYALISIIKSESWSVWDRAPSERWWLQYREYFLEKIRSKFLDCEKYISYRILSGKKLEECAKLDLPGEYSVEKFLNRLLNEVRKYSDQKARAIREFVLIDAMSGPWDLYIKIEGEKCIFLYFDHLNYCTCSEAVVETSEIDWALNKSRTERVETYFSFTLISAEFKNTIVVMEFLTPRGWLPASFCREDFERAYAKARQS